MADYIDLYTGFAPWEPADNVELVDVYDRFDIPTLGVIRQRGTDYLFGCVVGVGEPISYWSYTVITPAEKEKLDSAESGEDFDRTHGELPDGLPGMLAIVAEGYGIVAYRAVESTNDLPEVVRWLYEALDRWLARFRDSAETELKDLQLVK